MAIDRQSFYDHIRAESEQQVTHAIHYPAARRDRLTAREREVIMLVGEGLTDQEVAEQLCISVRTVQNHLHRSYMKLRVNNRMDAVQMVTRTPIAQKCESV
jgi:DNA-binding CsgD family transcriptional regulator